MLSYQSLSIDDEFSVTEKSKLRDRISRVEHTNIYMKFCMCFLSPDFLGENLGHDYKFGVD